MRTPVLNHGYVELIETWGSDENVIRAARMSTQKGFVGWGTPTDPGDEKLLKYLYDHDHLTPFEMAGMVIEVQAPIFVMREWHRHRTQSYNEMSARYSPLPEFNYIPTVERIMVRCGTNRQAGKAKGSAELTEVFAVEWQKEVALSMHRAEFDYQYALANGVPKELARILLPVGRYSRMRASANVRNWLAFLTLRDADDAQWEIRQYAIVVGRLIEEKFPHVWEVYCGRKL